MTIQPQIPRASRVPTFLPGRRLRPLLVFATALAFAWWFILVRAPSDPANTPDFTVFYAAAKPGPIYDLRWITSLQPGLGLRPFAYPPTFLLICRPLGLLPLNWAYGVWVAASATLFVEATAQLEPRGGAWLVLLSPLVLITAALGQTPLFIGGLIVLGMARLDRPFLAGVLFGIAFSIKPQVLLLLPVALVMGGQWRTLLVMGWAGLAMCVASLVFGPELWPQWLTSLSQFRAAHEAMHLKGLAAPMPFTPFCAIGALACLYTTRKADIPTRLIVIVAGSLLISPHAQTYELALLVPPGLSLLLARQWRSLATLPMLFLRYVGPWGLAFYVTAASMGTLRKFPEPLPLG